MVTAPPGPGHRGGDGAGGGQARPDHDRADPARPRAGRGRGGRVQHRPGDRGAAARGPGRVRAPAAQGAAPAHGPAASASWSPTRWAAPGGPGRPTTRSVPPGVTPVRDYRGEPDTYGNILEVTVAAVADEIAAAADLVKGKARQVPVAVVRGLAAPGHRARTARARGPLVRPADEDMFRFGVGGRAAGPPYHPGLHRRARRRRGGPPRGRRRADRARAAPQRRRGGSSLLETAAARTRAARRHARGLDRRPARRRVHRGADRAAGSGAGTCCGTRR